MGDEIGDAHSCSCSCAEDGIAVQLGESFTGALELAEAAEKSFTSVVMVLVFLWTVHKPLHLPDFEDLITARSLDLYSGPPPFADQRARDWRPH
jgi:hypothetical protein